MLIIPVIDIRNAQVVHARCGKRDDYRPLQTALCHNSDPLELVHAYLSLYPFTEIYLADLDAIEQTGQNDAVVTSLHNHFSDLTFWLDAGNNIADDLHSLERLRPVIGTETGVTSQQLACHTGHDSKPILSLDFLGSNLKGDASLLENTKSWPEDVIVMSLQRVGSGHGPDLDLLSYIQSIAAEKNLFMAGGIRSEHDLDELCSRGVAGVLLASALHNNKISVETLNKYRV